MAPTQIQIKIQMPRTPSTPRTPRTPRTLAAPKTPRKHTPIPFTPTSQVFCGAVPTGLRTPQSRPSARVPNAPRRARISTVPCARILFKGE